IQKAGIDPTYFGVIFVIVGCAGLLTPPVGTVLNVVCRVARVRMEDVIKGVMPYVITYTLLVMLMVIFPPIVLVPLDWVYYRPERDDRGHGPRRADRCLLW